MRQNGRLLLRIEALETLEAKTPMPVQPGLRVGSFAPLFDLQLAGGTKSSLKHLLELRIPILLVFSDANCGPCNAMRPDLLSWERSHSDRLTIAIITRGATANAIREQHKLRFVFIQKDREVAAQYQAVATPSGVLVSADGLIASPLVSGAPAIGELVSAVALGKFPLAPAPSGGAPTNVPQIGASAPAIKLPNLFGRSVDLEELRGHSVLLLFWNPSCGFCARMLPKLKEWEQTRRAGAPRLVLIAAGTEEQNRAMDLRSLILMDQSQAALQLFGANGTPSALLVDKEGRISSRLAVGADAIFQLVGESGTSTPSTKRIAAGIGTNGS